MEFNKENIIYGVLEVNNKTSYGLRNEKRFYPHDKNLPMFYVPTKKPFNPINIYCGIRFDKFANDKYYGIVEKYIGDIGNLDTELEYLKAIAINGWKGNSKFKLDEYFNDITNDRKDLTHLETYSIDPNGCTDIDDALSVEQVSDTEYKLYIHIADVSSFIKSNSELDIEICKRKESVYLNKFQVNMIPDKLSIEKISLKEGKVNRAFTLEIKLENYKIKSYTFYKSNIQLKNYSYDYFQKIYKTHKTLELLYNIGKVLYEKKFGEWADFDSHHMVEIYMIIANVIAGKEIKDISGAIFRKQDKNYEKISNNLLIDFTPAVYTIQNQSLYHNSLDEEVYTHFTSPMRRYIDIVVHRLLSNKFCSTNFEINCQEAVIFVNDLNNIHKSLKKISLTSQLYINIFDDNFKECDSYSGIIVGFNKNKIKVYIKTMGIINIKLFDNKFADLYEINNLENKLIIYDKIKDSYTTYELNQNINVQIAITKLSDKKINATIL